MIDFNSYTVVELRQWIKEYQEKNNTSFTGLSKMRKAELVELAITLNNSVDDGTPIIDDNPIIILDEVPNLPLTQEELTQYGERESLRIGNKSAVIQTSTSHSPNTVEIYNSLNRKQKRKFNKLCKGAIVLDDTEATWERLASCF